MSFPGPEAREVLLVPDHDLRDPDAPGLLERLHE